MQENFSNLLELFKPTLHIILLIWKNSKHYNTPARLVVLMREICNSLINQVPPTYLPASQPPPVAHHARPRRGPW